MPSEQSSVRLVELGPRMTMNLVKIEEGMLDGDVLYHKWVQKTDEEKKEIKIAREKRRKEKEKRKREQEQNVKKKEHNKEEHKQKSLEGMMRKKLQKLKDTGEDLPTQFQGEMADADSEDNSNEKKNIPSEDDTDEEWYRKEVGEEPEKDLFGGSTKGKRRHESSSNLDARFKKRMKRSSDVHPRSASKNNYHGDKQKNKKSPILKNSPSTTSGLHGKSVAKWKFKAGGATEKNRQHKGKAFSSDRKDLQKGNKKKSTRVFNSEGVGPNYRKHSAGRKKSYDSARSNKSKKQRR